MLKEISQHRKQLANKDSEADDKQISTVQRMPNWLPFHQNSQQQSIKRCDKLISKNMNKKSIFLALLLIVNMVIIIFNFVEIIGWLQLKWQILLIRKIKLEQNVYINGFDGAQNNKRQYIGSKIPFISQKYNLWIIPIDQKLKLLEKIKRLDYEGAPFILPLKNKDQETKEFFENYEKNIKQIKFQSLKLSDEDINLNKNQIEKLKKKKYSFLSNQTVDYQENGITKQQYQLALNISSLLISATQNNAQLKNLQSRSAQMLNIKYNIDQQLPELRTCVIVTSDDRQNNDYIRSIESLLNQAYINYKVVMIFDKNQEKLSNSVAKYLAYRKADPKKFNVIFKDEMSVQIEKIYYGVHKYCGYNEILITMNANDELISKRVFTTLNNIYQKEKIYGIYTQHLISTSNAAQIPKIGSSQDYPEVVRQQNRYLHYRSVNGPLKSMMSDLFLFQQTKNLKFKDKNNFYQILADETVWYSAYQMSCQNIIYLPELFYLKTERPHKPYDKKRLLKMQMQLQEQKRYKCLQHILEDIQKVW